MFILRSIMVIGLNPCTKGERFCGSILVGLKLITTTGLETNITQLNHIYDGGIGS